MNIKQKVLIVIVYTAAVASVSIYMVPQKVKTEIKTVEVEKKVVAVNEKKHKETKVIIVKKTDGEEETTETITEDTNTDTKAKIDDKSVVDSTSETTRGDSKVTVSALGGIDIFTKQPIYGASVYKPILGPFGLGIWGLSNSSCGVSVGITF